MTCTSGTDTCCWLYEGTCVRRFTEQASLPPAGAIRAEEMINYFDYAYRAEFVKLVGMGELLQR